MDALMVLLARVIGCVTALFLLVPAAWALDPALYAVQIEKPTGDGKTFSHGSGVSLGGGLILTAAHVVQVNPSDPAVTVLMKGVLIPGHVVKTAAPETLDLAAIQIDWDHGAVAQMHHPWLPICSDYLPISAPALVAAQGKVTRAKTVGTPITALGQTTNGWTNLLSTAYEHGASGGGVFEATKECLSGILYLQLKGPSLTDGSTIALTAFVTAPQIRSFLGLP